MLGIGDSLGVVEKNAVVGRGAGGGDRDAAALRSRGDGLNLPAHFFAAAGELTAELGDQSGGALIVGAVKRAPRHGGNDSGNGCHGHEYGQREQHQQSSPQAHGLSPDSQVLFSDQVPSGRTFKP